MAEFHFLRPWWLLAAPLGVLFLWRMFSGKHVQGSWRAVVDASLQPFVLALPDQLVERRAPMIIAALAWLAAVLALAGPSWERLPVPAFRSDEALVVALDLSRSMDASDVEPSRLARAKLKLLSLLERRGGGQTGLVVFSAHAFTVTPLTTDTRTIGSLIGSLFTSIMPSQGSYPEAGLEKAGALLRQTGLTQGEILLISDAEPSPRALAVARELRREGFAVHVLAVGTEEGAPIPDPEGGFVTDASGQVVVPQLDLDGLRRLAEAGRGRFARLSADDRDLESLFPEVAPVGQSISDDGNEYEADVWRDQGVWIVLALLPIVALGFRRGWVTVAVVWLAWPGTEASAFEWRDLWIHPDRQAYEAIQANDAARAAELFEDPAWRGAAQYRAGDFASSVATLGALDDAEAHYNRGNALARSGQLEPAVQAYDRALGLDPEHEDARYNRELLEELLRQQQEEQQDQEQQRAGDQSQQGESGGEGEESDGDQSDASESESGDEATAESSSSPGQGSDDSARQRPDDQGADSPEPQQAEAEQEQEGQGEQQQDVEGDPSQMPGPDELEQWASEQAADQWLRRVPQDPGGLLRRKFLYQYQRLGIDQDGNYVWPGDESEPW